MLVFILIFSKKVFSYCHNIYLFHVYMIYIHIYMYIYIIYKIYFFRSISLNSIRFLYQYFYELNIIPDGFGLHDHSCEIIY